MKFLSRRRESGLVPIALLIVALVLLFPLHSEAYAGPGAGFAVLSSFWTIFVAFLYSFYALVTWPIRQLLRMFRRRKAYGKAQVKRVVIVGFDGMDPELASRFMGEGRLPNSDQAARQRDVSSAANYISRDLSRGVVDVSDRGQSRQAQHIRFSGARSEELSSVSFLGTDQRAQTSSEDWQVLAAAGQVRCQRSAQRDALLALAGQGGSFLFGHSRASNFSAGKVSRRAALRHVRPRPEGQPGDILLLHHAGQQRQVSRGRRANSGREATEPDFIPTFLVQRILWAQAETCAPISRFARM